jgi:hypothetical protein
MTTMETIQATMIMEDDTYYAIIEQLGIEDEEGNPMYSVEEIAQQFGVTIEIVEYIYRSEYCD